MQELLASSLAAYASIRNAIVEDMDQWRHLDPEYASYAGQQLRFYSSRCQAMTLLIQDSFLWDADILFRPALECATRFLFVSSAVDHERHKRIIEYRDLLGEIEDLERTDKLRTAASNATDKDDAMLLGGAALAPEQEERARAKWNRQKRKALKQKWSFSEIARGLTKIAEPTLDLRAYGSLLHSYGLSSHLIHADSTAMLLVNDRATRKPHERSLLERAHFARLAVQQTTLFFVCWRAFAHAMRQDLIRDRDTGIAGQLDALLKQENKYHEEFAASQEHLYR